jgi:hypothetical protein
LIYEVSKAHDNIRIDAIEFLRVEEEAWLLLETVQNVRRHTLQTYILPLCVAWLRNAGKTEVEKMLRPFTSVKEGEEGQKGEKEVVTLLHNLSQ